MKTFKHFFAALLLLCSTVATAHDFVVDGIYYSFTADYDLVTGSWFGGDYVAVTYRGDDAYSMEEYFNLVEIPAEVTYEGTTYQVVAIGDNAFAGNAGLRSLIIPNSVKLIGHNAFSECDGLSGIEIPESVVSVGSYVFEDTKWFANQPNGPVYVGKVLYKYIGKAPENTALVIEEGTVSIAYEAFYNASVYADCSGITSIEIPNSVTSIGARAFSGCTSLTSIVVAEGNTKYDSRENCNAIIETAINTLIRGCKNTIIPDSVTSIGYQAFYGCTGLTSIEIPDGVTSIGDCAFLGCTGLTSIEIPNSVTSIDTYAFSGCTGLTSIEIPNSVTSIRDYAFYDTPWYNNQPDGVIYVGKCLYKYKGDMPANTSIVIEEGTLSISPRAFEYCTGLTNIEIPNTVISIEYYAFSGCTGLTSITLPASATEYGSALFCGCTGLTSIISYISAEDVADRSANNYFDVFYDFDFDFAACTLYVPYGAKETYAASNHWDGIENIVEMAYELNVTAAGYATLYLGYAAEIPAGVEVYTANAVEDDRLKMQPVEGVIPANTGVIVKAAAGTYTFNNADDAVAAIEGNLFKGSLKDETVKVASGKAAYVLSMVDGEVGMYRAELTGHSFLNNANKAYLLLDSNNLGVYDDEWDTSAGGQLSNGYRFDFGGITGIENVKGESGEVKAIYDLSGRAVENPSKGLYIINGKKVMVK